MSTKKTVSNTFTVSTVEDGESAPYYFQEWFAWSNDSTTASVTTPPTISGLWETSIPSQGSYAYLWRKSIRYVWNESTRQYIGEDAQYVRMTGTNGTSINTKGTIKVAITASGTFPTSGFSNGDLGVKQGDSYMWQFNGSSWSHVSSASSNGDSYTMTKDCTIDLDGDGTSENIKGHLIQWSTEASKWIDLGQFKGESGKTYYTHIAWATNVIYSGSTVTSVEGFVTTKSPNDTTHIWMGVLIDDNSGQDSDKATTYTWSNTKGVKGEDSLSLVLDTYAIAFPTDSYYYVESELTYTVEAKMFLGNNAPQTIKSLTATSSDSDVYTSGTSPANGVKITIGENTFENTVKITVTATCAKGSRTATINLTPTPQGEHGIRGEVGRFFYFGGTFDSSDSTQTFVVNDAQAPYFEHTVDGQKRYHVFNYSTNDSYTMAQMWSISNQSWSTPWELMTNDFKYLITEAIFGRYAHFGSFIINDDWMISQHGVIYDTNGDIHTIDASHSYGNYNVNNAYTLFDVDYPNSSKPNANNFVPNFAVDGRTGATHQNKAYIRGELDVRELGQNAGWILSPYLEQDYYKIPSIDGFDKDGILTMRLLFDGDDSDGYAPREGGGLLINEKKWNASAQKYEPYNVARYNREAWCVSSTDHPDDSYMFGGMSSEEPYIHGKTYIQSNQTHKEFYLGITSLGLWFQSDSWQTYRSNMQDGEVYVDDWDNMMVKNSRSYKQFNIVRGNCTLPSGCPVGTVYYVKGTGATTVSVTSDSNDWIEGWDDNNSKGNSVGIQSNSVQFVKTATHIWTMFIGI